MIGKRLNARFYATAAGREPVREWLLRISPEDRRTVGYDIGKIEDGWPLGMPLARSLGVGLWEVRSDLSGGRIARVIFIAEAGVMILLHGFEKKSQKTPQGELEIARKRLADFRRR